MGYAWGGTGRSSWLVDAETSGEGSRADQGRHQKKKKIKSTWLDWDANREPSKTQRDARGPRNKTAVCRMQARNVAGKVTGRVRLSKRKKGIGRGSMGIRVKRSERSRTKQ